MQTNADRASSTPSGLEILHCQPKGDPAGPPVLFVHGLGHAAACWRNWLAAAAADGMPAFAVSLTGHGGSTRPAARARLSTYVRDVLNVARSLPGGPPILVGHSLGGLVVQRILPHFTPRAAILVAPIPPWPALGTVWSVSRRRPLQTVRLLASLPIRLDPDLLYPNLDPTAQSALGAEHCHEPRLAQYQLLWRLPSRRRVPSTPRLCVGSRADRVVPIRDVRLTARYYGAECIEFDRIGHDLMLDDGWQAPWRQISEWLDTNLVPADQGRPGDAKPAGETEFDRDH